MHRFLFLKLFLPLFCKVTAIEAYASKPHKGSHPIWVHRRWQYRWGTKLHYSPYLPVVKP